MATIDYAIMALVGLIIATSLIMISRNFSISISGRDQTASDKAQLESLIRECWRKDPVQDCFIIKLNSTISPFDPGIPVEWRAVNGTVKVSRERDKVVVNPF